MNYFFCQTGLKNFINTIEDVLKLFTFKKGVHPEEYKNYAQDQAIEELPLPKNVYIPLQQHIGKPSTPIVQKKDEVKTGQLIAKADGVFSSNIHSTVTGKVKAIANFMHPMGVRVPMIHIQRTDDAEELEFLETPEDWTKASPDDLAKLVFDAGIVGLGGALFPTHIKLKVPEGKTVDSLILNGCECEPYLTCDHRMMVEWADRIITGMAIMLKILSLKDGYIGIESNKPDAIRVMEERVKALGYDYKVCPLQVKYPQGAEKMLIQAILNRDVPAGGLPADAGAIVNNVGTAAAITDAVMDGRPLISRVVTLTGDAITEPKNIHARIGTPYSDAIEFCGGVKDNVKQIISGGPMMGVAQFDMNAPMVKGTSGLVFRSNTSEDKHKEEACIRCNSCVRACPMLLMPNRLSRFSEMDKIDEANEFGINNCISCGSCVFACPSRIPILQWIKVGRFKLHSRRK